MGGAVGGFGEEVTRGRTSGAGGVVSGWQYQIVPMAMRARVARMMRVYWKWRRRLGVERRRQAVCGGVAWGSRARLKSDGFVCEGALPHNCVGSKFVERGRWCMKNNVGPASILLSCEMMAEIFLIVNVKPAA